MVTRFRLIAALTAILLVASACQSSSQNASKAGGPALPLVLKIGTDDNPGRPASDQIEEFGRRVNDLSDGSITIEPVWHSAGDGPDWDQRVARMVVGGQLDMGNIPARAWDTEGVTSLRALNAPFLITTDDLVTDVITSELANDLMSGLADIGVVGLVLLPEGLRHPFGFDGPMAGPEDYKGKTIRMPTSDTTRAMYAAFGATTTDNEPNGAEQAAMDSSYLLRPPGVATGNVTFYPKVNSLVINAAVWTRLTDEQRSILTEAATTTQTWAIDATPTDAEAAAAFCEVGQIAMADDAAVDALVAAAAPVYTELEQDDLTKSLIDGIREMKAQVPVAEATPVACGEAAPPPQAAGAATTPIDGVYRFEVTEEELRAGGVAESKVRGLTGVYTFTFDRGEVSFVQTGPYPESAASDTADHFVVDGDQLTIVWPDGKTEVVKWSSNANGDLTLTIVTVPADWLAEDQVYTSKPWIRIGDVPGARLPDGIYRVEIDLADVLAAGETNDDGATGIWTLQLTDGTYSLTCAILDDRAVDCGHSGGTSDVLEAGFARVTGNRVAFVYDAGLHSQLTGCTPPCFPMPTYQVTWSTQGDSLVFRHPSDDGIGSAALEKVLSPWTRIGDVESGFPEGIYRFESTEDELRAAGATDPVEIANNIGIWTWKISGGDWCFEQKAPTVEDRQCGTYTVDGDEITIEPWYDIPELVFRWETTPNGDLQLRFRQDQPARSVPVLRATFETPWVRIGDASN